MSTRAVLAIPAAAIIAGICGKDIKRFILLSAGSILIFGLTLLPFYLWDSELFMKHNPLTLHANKSVPGLVPITLLISLIVGFFSKKFSTKMFVAGTLMSSITVVTIFAILMETPLNELFTGALVDVSYLTMGLPFLMIALMKNEPPKLNN